MKRSKRLVVMCHCLLNSNSKISGLSHYSGALLPVVNEYLTSGAGIIQLPCPELTYLGLKRWGMTKDQYDTIFYKHHCAEILKSYVEQIIEYTSNGYSVECVVGVDGSPSCGVHYTCKGYCGGIIDEKHPQSIREVAEQGVFIRELCNLLNPHSISIPFKAINEKNPL